MPSTKLETKIVATDAFTGNLKKAENAIKGFGNRLKKPFGEVGAAVTSLRGAIAAFGVAIGARFAARTIAGVADFADEIGKLSERVGVSTEQLSTLRFAAEQTGTDFNTVATAIRTATQRIGEFAGTGKGQAAEALKALGIAEAVRDGQQLEELLPRIADAFQGVSSQAERVNLASKIFGETGGPAFLNLLQQGSRGLADFRTEAERLGIVVSGQAAKSAAEFNDELNRIKQTFRGFLQETLTPLLPELTEFGRQLRSILADMKAARQERSQALQDLAKAQGAGGKGIPRLIPPSEFAPSPPGPKPGDFDFIGPVQQAAPGAESPQKAVETTRQMTSAVRALRQESFTAADGLEDLRRQFAQLSSARAIVVDVGNALADNITTGLIDIAEGTKTAKQAFSDMARSILSDLQRIIIRALVAQAFGALLGPGGGAVGGAVASFQSGGFVPAGRTQRAILHGPELVVPLNRKFGPQIGGGGGGGTTIINISAIDVEDFDRKWLGAMRRNDSTMTGMVARSARNTQQLRGAFA